MLTRNRESVTILANLSARPSTLARSKDPSSAMALIVEVMLDKADRKDVEEMRLRGKRWAKNDI
jgi:hypothetical protein